MKKRYTFVPCTGPIEFDEGVKVNVMHKGDVATITCMGGGWYWPNDIPVTDWNNIFVLTESPSTPILGAEEVLKNIADKNKENRGILITTATALEAMQTHSAQYRDECEKLKKENKKLKSLVKKLGDLLEARLQKESDRDGQPLR